MFFFFLRRSQLALHYLSKKPSLVDLKAFLLQFYSLFSAQLLFHLFYFILDNPGLWLPFEAAGRQAQDQVMHLNPAALQGNMLIDGERQMVHPITCQVFFDSACPWFCVTNHLMCRFRTLVQNDNISVKCRSVIMNFETIMNPMQFILSVSRHFWYLVH